jgi:hypothetical protein
VNDPEDAGQFGLIRIDEDVTVAADGPETETIRRKRLAAHAYRWIGSNPGRSGIVGTNPANRVAQFGSGTQCQDSGARHFRVRSISSRRSLISR